MPVQSWDPFNKHVQGGLREYNYLSGRNTLICAGPPYLSSIIDLMAGGGNENTEVLYPIGLAQNFAISQNSAVQQIHEIGGERPYFFRGRTVRQVSLGRIVYHGPSLLRLMYSWYNDSVGTSGVEPVHQVFGTMTDLPDYLKPFVTNDQSGTQIESRSGIQSTKLSSGMPEVRIPPGYENVWINLASDLFKMPTGLFFLMRDNEDNNVAGYYLEQCHIPTHTMAVDSQGLIIQETISIICGNLVPVNVNGVSLLKGLFTQKEFMDQSSVQQQPVTS